MNNTDESSQRHLRKQINALLKLAGWNPRKHHVEFAFGTLSGKQYTSNNRPGDLGWDGRSGFGRDFPLVDGDTLNVTIAWKPSMYESAEFDAHGGDCWMSEPTFNIVAGQVIVGGE